MENQYFGVSLGLKWTLDRVQNLFLLYIFIYIITKILSRKANWI
jgi:hypothetical protein